MKTEQNLKIVASILPANVKRSINMLPDEVKSTVREILLRTSKPIMLVGNDVYFLKNYGRVGKIDSPDSLKMTPEMMNRTFMNMCNDSVYTYIDNINEGFLTLSGGNRVGVCGRFVQGLNGQKSIRNVSSLSIRIAGEYIGASDKLMRAYARNGLGTTIIVGPPCSGKTTLLRDICRNLSSGILERNAKVSLIDERCEISGIDCNDISLNVGVNTDIYLNYDKTEAISMSVRTMSPDIVVFDELGTVEEVEAVCNGMNCGIAFAFSIHADSLEELYRKEQYKLLCKNTSLKYIVILERERPGRIKEVLISNENNCFVPYCESVGVNRISWEKRTAKQDKNPIGNKAATA